MICYIFIIFIVMVLNTVSAQQEGWKMKDRFIGFRYEFHGSVKDVGLREEIQAKADELACFGWAQNSPRDTVVGEVRCNKNAGVTMKTWMGSIDQHHKGSSVHRVDVMEYDDTKIKLHFSHFKILSDGRETCFRDEPHRCDHFNDSEL
mmetsp:Transcript_648/g.837  ORF Transcript_648/g.837 Transcript_648/m.837 type:complete len:148 (-) Transcript_648:172-615(-)|eukprot:CAMPEP_0185735476 /NCGR_PEP_ID=MMETSP1171-20130828/25374_1 /TAXON_ID=374046 /ORGANISM="Helicotheca tamensis, Strain CCMP826" /LENGTH=147 /DNA_ID=CAMNT_0028405801 /DNA_START=61 /DNA_END=504 /DNA_ORIENTATION=-